MSKFVLIFVVAQFAYLITGTRNIRVLRASALRRKRLQHSVHIPHIHTLLYDREHRMTAIACR